jgi:hypothetical protein
MLITYPSLPISDYQFQLRNGIELRDLIKTCANNGIDFKLLYDHGGKFRYFSDPCRSSR